MLVATAQIGEVQTDSSQRSLHLVFVSVWAELAGDDALLAEALWLHRWITTLRPRASLLVCTASPNQRMVLLVRIKVLLKVEVVCHQHLIGVVLNELLTFRLTLCAFFAVHPDLFDRFLQVRNLGFEFLQLFFEILCLSLVDLQEFIVGRKFVLLQFVQSLRVFKDLLVCLVVLEGGRRLVFDCCWPHIDLHFLLAFLVGAIAGI